MVTIEEQRNDDDGAEDSADATAGSVVLWQPREENDGDNQDNSDVATGSMVLREPSDSDNQSGALEAGESAVVVQEVNDIDNEDVADAVTRSEEESAAKDGENRGADEESAAGIDFARLTHAEILGLSDKDYGRYKEWDGRRVADMEKERKARKEDEKDTKEEQKALEKKKEEDEKKVQAVASGLLKQAEASGADRDRRAQEGRNAGQDTQNRTSQNVQKRVGFEEQPKHPPTIKPPEPLTHLNVPDHSESRAPPNALTSNARKTDPCDLLKICSQGKALQGVCLNQNGKTICEPTRSLIDVTSAKYLALTSCDAKLQSVKESYAVAAKFELNMSSLWSWGFSSVTSLSSAVSAGATTSTNSEVEGTANSGSTGGSSAVAVEGKYSACHSLQCVKRYAINLPLKEDLCLSSEAVRVLMEIEKARKESEIETHAPSHHHKVGQLGAKVTDFFRTFGSHLPAGPVILGGMHNAMGVAWSAKVTAMGTLESSARQAMEKEIASSKERDPTVMIKAAGGFLSGLAGFFGGPGAAQAAGGIADLASAAAPKESHATSKKDTVQSASESRKGGSAQIEGVVSKAKIIIKGGTHFSNVEDWKAALEYNDENLAVVDQGEYLIPVHELVMQDKGLDLNDDDRKALADCLRSRYYCSKCSYCNRAFFPACLEAHEEECKSSSSVSLYQKDITRKLKDGYELGQWNPNDDDTLGYYLVERIKCDICNQRVPAVDNEEHEKLCRAGSRMPTCQVGVSPGQVRLKNGEFKHVYLHFPHHISREQRLMFREGWNWAMESRVGWFRNTRELCWVYRVTDMVNRAIVLIHNGQSQLGFSLLSNVATHVYSLKKEDADFKEARDNLRAALECHVGEASAVVGNLPALAWSRQEFSEEALEPKNARLILRSLRNERKWNNFVNSQELEQIKMVMASKETSMEILTEICRQLRNVTHGDASNAAETRRAIVDSRIVERVLRAMEGEGLASEELQVEACAALGNLAADSYGRDYIAIRGGIDRIAAAAQRHPKSERVLEQARGALSNILNGRGIDSILELARERSSADDTADAVIKKKRGIPAVVAVMSAYLQTENVQEQACAALRDLAWANDDNRVVVREAGGIPAIIRAMNERPKAERVQENACGALWSLAYNNSDNKVAVREAGGIPAVVRAMTVHPQAEKVQVQACCALYNLAIVEENKAPIRDAGGVRAIVGAMNEHPKAERVQEEACRALYNLVFNNSDNSDAVREAGGIPAVVRAMAAHPWAEGVQWWACAALFNLARLKENKAAIRDAGGVRQLEMAKEKHAGSANVKYYADYALKKL